MGMIISFTNQKGGVGKTTSAVNVAASLGVLGKKVLLVDLDPQGNATSGVGIAKKHTKGSMFEVINGEMEPEDVIIDTEFANLSVLPANIRLAGSEFDLHESEQSEHQIAAILEPLKDQYDYIILDCPPSLGMLTVNAITASDGIIVPMQCEFFAMEGLSELMRTAGIIRKNLNPKLTIVGIVLTMYNGRLLLTNQVVYELKKHYEDKLFRTPISRNVKLSEAPSFGKPVYYHDRHSKGSEEYMDIAKELIERT